MIRSYTIQRIEYEGDCPKGQGQAMNPAEKEAQWTDRSNRRSGRMGNFLYFFVWATYWSCRHPDTPKGRKAMETILRLNAHIAREPWLRDAIAQWFKSHRPDLAPSNRYFQASK